MCEDEHFLSKIMAQSGEIFYLMKSAGQEEPLMYGTTAAKY